MADPERERAEHKSVADVAEDQSKEHREEHGDERGGVDGTVGRERHHAGDCFEGPEESRVLQHHGRGFSLPVFARHRFDHHPFIKPSGEGLRKPGESLSGNPTFHHEAARRGSGLLTRGDAEQAVLHGGPCAPQLGCHIHHERAPLRVEGLHLGVEDIAARREGRAELAERPTATPLRHRQFVHPCLCEEPLDAGRVGGRDQKDGREFPGRERRRLEDELVADGLAKALAKPRHDTGVLPPEDQVIAVGSSAAAAREQAPKGPDELEKPCRLRALFLESPTPGLDPIRLPAGATELPQPAGKGGRSGRRHTHDRRIKPRRQRIDVAQQVAEASRFSCLARLRLDRTEDPGRASLRELQQPDILHRVEHDIELLAGAKDAGANHREYHDVRSAERCSTCSTSQRACASTAASSTAWYRAHIAASPAFSLAMRAAVSSLRRAESSASAASSSAASD